MYTKSALRRALCIHRLTLLLVKWTNFGSVPPRLLFVRWLSASARWREADSPGLSLIRMDCWCSWRRWPVGYKGGIVSLANIDDLDAANPVWI